MQIWRNTNSFYNEWDLGCICRTYKTMPQKIIYCYMEDKGYKYNHKMTQFVTTLKSRRSCSIDLMPESVKHSDFLSILYSKPLLEFRKPKIKIGDKIGISKCNLSFSKGNKPQFTPEVYEIFAISSQEPPIYKLND